MGVVDHVRAVRDNAVLQHEVLPEYVRVLGGEGARVAEELGVFVAGVLAVVVQGRLMFVLLAAQGTSIN
mgnify:FL=1